MITSFLEFNEIYSVLPQFVEETLDVQQDSVKKQLFPILNLLIDEVVFFIEFPYVDRFYRDSFYSFYAKKHFSYPRDSIRISIFSNKLDIDNYYLSTEDDLNKCFYGFITIRPTSYKIIGHSFFSPQALKKNNFVCCLSKKTVLINGRKLAVHGFPFCSQDNEAITCSETALINLMDYFSHRYPEYCVILPTQINKILAKLSFQRQLPSKGLPTDSISYVLKKLGFGTIVYTINKGPHSNTFEDFFSLLYIYIESGIPLIATLNCESKNHALLVIGRKHIDSKIEFDKLSIQAKIKGFFGVNESYSFHEAFSEILVMNDNHTPYELINYQKPIFEQSFNKFYSIISFIVPLYPKVHMEAFQFKHYYKACASKLLFYYEFDLFPSNAPHITRYFLTSSKSYKNYLAKSELSKEFKTILIELSMPKFVWIGETILGSSMVFKNPVYSVLVIDATESGLKDHIIFAYNSKNMILSNKLKYFSTFEQNASTKRISDSQFSIITDYPNEKFITFASNLKGQHNSWLSY